MQRKFKRLQAKSGPAHHRRWQPGQNDPKSWEISGLEVPVVPDARADDENLDVAEDFREHHFRHLREAQAFTAQITEADLIGGEMWQAVGVGRALRGHGLDPELSGKFPGFEGQGRHVEPAPDSLQVVGPAATLTECGKFLLIENMCGEALGVAAGPPVGLGQGVAFPVRLAKWLADPEGLQPVPPGQHLLHRNRHRMPEGDAGLARWCFDVAVLKAPKAVLREQTAAGRAGTLEAPDQAGDDRRQVWGLDIFLPPGRIGQRLLEEKQGLDLAENTVAI